MALASPSSRPAVEALAPEDWPNVEALMTEDDTPVDTMFSETQQRGSFDPDRRRTCCTGTPRRRAGTPAH